MHRFIFNAIIILSALTCGAINDEPDELSWEFFAGSRKCFENFERWIASNPSVMTSIEKINSKQNYIMPLPEKFTSVRVYPSAFPKGHKQYSHARIKGKDPVLQLSAGHNKSFARALVTIPAGGAYRIWVRYYHLKGYHSTFRLRLLPSEMSEYKFPWQSSAKGEFFSFRYDNAYHRRKKNVLPTNKDKPSGFMWEDAPLVYLKAGCYTLEIANCIHAGPYAKRQISNVLITRDPLLVPSPEFPESKNLSSGIAISAAAPSPKTKRSWHLWQLRPGATSLAAAPPQIIAIWRQWRRQFIAMLTTDKLHDPEYLKMSQMVYFNPDYNLIGTPGQVAKYVEQARKKALEPDSKKWFLQVECEDMKSKIGNGDSWRPGTHRSASGGMVITGAYHNGFSGVATPVDIPANGKYHIWVRHMNLKKYYSIFQLGMRRNNESKDFVQFTFGDAEDKKNYSGNGMYWKCATAELSRGRFQLRLTKNKGKSPYTYRRVDKIIITDDPAWKPEKSGILPYQADLSHGKSLVTAWIQKKTWQGFSQLSVPGSSDTIDPDTYSIQIRPDEVESCLILLRNNSSTSQTIFPAISGDDAKMAQWRTVAFVLSAAYGWQPQPLLRRNGESIPPRRNAAIWLTIDGRNCKPGNKEFTLILGERRVKFKITVAGTSLAKAPTPLVGGWSSPYNRASSWQMFSDIGLNVIHRIVIPQKEMQEYKIRLFDLIPVSYKNISAQKVDDVVRTIEGMGLAYRDWAWEIFDEPGTKKYKEWLTGAQKVRKINPEINIWCNPGEIQGSSPAANLAMMPYINIYCPYVNQFTMGARTPGYLQKLMRTGNIKLIYTTPCGHEKAPHAPLEMFYIAEMSIKYQRDGWDFFSVCNYYGYHNTPWDDLGAFSSHQAVSIYPGAYGQTISTRNLEAVRAAIQYWKKQKLKKTE